MTIVPYVKDIFAEREKKVIELIKKYNIAFEEIGVFGSYSRGNYKTTSDIDFCVITDNKPDRHISGCLREEAEILGADIIFITRDYFENSNTIFAENVRNDYRRCE